MSLCQLKCHNTNNLCKQVGRLPWAVCIEINQGMIPQIGTNTGAVQPVSSLSGAHCAVPVPSRASSRLKQFSDTLYLLNKSVQS